MWREWPKPNQNESNQLNEQKPDACEGCVGLPAHYEHFSVHVILLSQKYHYDITYDEQVHHYYSSMKPSSSLLNE